MPEETTASMWADVNALKKKTSLSEKDRSKQRVESLLNELEGRTASFTDEALARIQTHHGDKRSRWGACECCAVWYSSAL